MSVIALAAFALGRTDTATVTFRPRDGHWWLWLPCRTCGGVALPLRRRVNVLDAQPCPGCETFRRRLEPAGPDPVVWYDTGLRDWVVHLPCDGSPDGALMPLEIHWYDAAWKDVFRTAADLVYAGEPD